MSTEDVILAIIVAHNGELTGRTYLQKTAYFVSRELNLRMGFSPHYYGPYSREVSAALGTLVTRGVLQEKQYGLHHPSPGEFERIVYEYSILDSADAYVATVKEDMAESFGDVVSAVGQVKKTGADYRQLSYAAKLHHILEATSEPGITVDEVKQQAWDLGWEMTHEDVAKAVEVLQQLKMA